jgi:6-phosphogluconolactonase
VKQKLQIRHLPTPEKLAEAAAVELLGLLVRRPNLTVPFGIALSGGRIAAPFYNSIVASAQRGQSNRVRFDEVHFFWADERCVPPASPESNYAVARESLFEPLEIPASSIHRIRAEMEGSYPVAEAEAELARLMPLNHIGQPVLDLVILGMGEDGHVASLFPEEGPEWITDGGIYRRVTATKPPPDRITVGYQPILAAREVWVLASGIGKLSALRALLAGDERLPVARVAAGRDKTLLFQDIEKSEN